MTFVYSSKANKSLGLKIILLLLPLFPLGSTLKANETFFIVQKQDYAVQKSVEGFHSELMESLTLLNDTVGIEPYQNKKWIAITATILLGPFGGHRLYLGTNTKVPVVYTLTLGGGLGLLPLIDLIHIIATKELSPYEQNEKVFMWAK
jgi:TM2 domain-containing membrane protein YozV